MTNNAPSLNAERIKFYPLLDSSQRDFNCVNELYTKYERN